jgi:hypothetical protein
MAGIATCKDTKHQAWQTICMIVCRLGMLVNADAASAGVAPVSH